MNMKLRTKLMMSAATLVAAVAVSGLAAVPARAQDTKALESPDGKDWLTYHGSYKSWHYSPLKQINADNVKHLKVAWIEQVGRSTRGVQSMPLANDGILYFSASYSKVFAIKGDTGEVLWTFVPKLDEELIARQTHTPYNRGIAM